MIGCAVTSDLDRYMREVDRADARESAVAEVESDLHAKWLLDGGRLAEACLDAQEALNDGPGSAIVELYLLIVTDPAEFGHRLARLALAKLAEQAAAEAPDEFEAREREAIDDYAADRAADREDWQ